MESTVSKHKAGAGLASEATVNTHRVGAGPAAVNFVGMHTWWHHRNAHLGLIAPGEEYAEPWSGKIPHATEQLSPCATTTEPAL